MIKYIIHNTVVLLAIISIISCTNQQTDNHEGHDHGSSEQDHTRHNHGDDEKHDDTHDPHIDEDTHDYGNEVITIIQNNYEVYISMNTWVKNETTSIDIHLTKLNDYKPLALNEVDIVIKGANTGSIHAHSHGEGIYHATFEPLASGLNKMRIAFKVNNKPVYLTVENITAYINDDAIPKQKPEDASLIYYSKEQAWAEDFGIEVVELKDTPRLIKTSGKIMPAPGDEFIVTALHAGTINLNSQLIEGKKIKSGEIISTISSSLIHENITSKYLRAKNEYEKAKLDYDRAKNLIDEKLISEKEYLEAKLNYESSKNTFQNISKYYNDGNQQLKSPTDGYIRSVFVKEGQYIEEGQPIATIIRNKRILLKANMPQQYNHLSSSIFDANFSPVYTNNIYSIKGLNGLRISYSMALPDNSQFVPLYFEIDAHPDIMPGSYTEIYLKSASFSTQLTVPVEALMEDQGNYYVYVQKDGEHYQKTYVQVGDSDGIRAGISSGLNSGDIVVNKGAYQVYLSSLGSAAPTHTHAH